MAQCHDKPEPTDLTPALLRQAATKSDIHSSKLKSGRKAVYKSFTGIRSNRWTRLFILIGSGNLYSALNDTVVGT